MIFYTSIKITTLTFQSLFTFMNCGHAFFHTFQELVSQQSHFFEIFSSWIELLCCFKWFFIFPLYDNNIDISITLYLHELRSCILSYFGRISTTTITSHWFLFIIDWNDMLFQMILHISIKITTLTFQWLLIFMNWGHVFFYTFQELISQQSHFIDTFSSWIELKLRFKWFFIFPL